MAITYRLILFDGLALPEYNPNSNMGTGAALTSYTQLPGGGFFDNYGQDKSPQGIRDINYDCRILNDSATIRQQELTNLRSKIGVLGKLAVKFDDDTIRWQWARLVNLNAPNSWEQTTWLPVSLTFRTVSQIWYSTVYSDTAWTWGDKTWTFSDGTATIGQGSRTYTIDEATETIDLDYYGSIAAVDTVIRYTNSDADNVTNLVLSNANASGYSILTYAGTIQQDETLHIDHGLLQCLILSNEKPISSVAVSGSTVTFTAGADPSISVNDYFLVRGTDGNDGYYQAITGTATTTVKARNRFAIAESSPTGATIAKATDGYSNLTFLAGEERNMWFRLNRHSVAIDSVSHAAGTVTVVTQAIHGLAVGDYVTIQDTENFDTLDNFGVAGAQVATASDDFTFTITWSNAYATESIGTVYGHTNTLTVSTTMAAGLPNATLTLEYAEHHA